MFIDDFHYIPRDAQVDIGRQIKEAAEAGVRICTASVPHRADDVVRSNTELRGRVTAVDTGRWSEKELEQIGYKGFQALNMDIAPTVMNKLTAEAFGSPQLMQAICLNVCFENKVYETLPEQRRIEIWPAPGSEDTKLGVLMEPEVDHGAAEVYAGVQA